MNHTMIFYIWAVVLIAVLALYFRNVYSKFSNYGIKHDRPVPLLGNMTGALFRITHFVDVLHNLYKAYPEERFVGNYEFMKPIVVVRDLELIKKITVKDFEHFLDHRNILKKDVEPLFSRTLLVLKGQEWKDMRSTLSPAFTSSKMKHMLPFIVEVGNRMVSSLKEKLQKAEGQPIDIEVKDLSTRFANDVIASCAFGLRVDSHAEPDNEFFKMGDKSSNVGFWAIMKFIVYNLMPSLAKKMKMSIFTHEVAAFFMHIVLSSMKDREAHNILRPDMIHLLMEAKKGQLKHEDKADEDANAGFATVDESTVGKKTVDKVWSDTDLVAQAALFFLAGYETVSTAMAFFLYELAVNPEVQDKLAQEIKEHEALTGGKFDYNSIQKMPYMDMCISELLRLWPPAVATDRVCNKEYNLGRPNDKAAKDYIMKKDDVLHIPIYAIHRDPAYFPEPHKFDPERFSEENKHKIQPFTYMPFGLGPRNCIGSRFALCEVKVMVYQLLQHMKVEPSEKTTIPVQLAKDSLGIRIKGGHWLHLTARN
uniref:unspecific monooxygenase n=1 Tax=Adoxophyes honmai TaxID=85585 RepID=A0A455R5F3_ADOHO|nr:cytochrome P450 monooxygenase [Adoxophyes honmai]